MKKTFSSPLMLVSFILLTMLVASCANNSLNTLPMVENPEENQGNQPTELRSVTDQLRSIDPEALAYCNNAKTIMYGTSAFERPKAIQSYEMLMDNDSSLVENPMSLRLQSLTIEDEESGKSVDFFDMSVEQKQVFVDMLLVEDAKMLTERINVAPEFKNMLQRENLITSRVIERNQLVNREIGLVHSGLRSLSEKTVDAKDFFKELYNEFEVENNTPSTQPQLRGIGGSISFNYPKVPIKRVKYFWQKYARRGDFIVAIPNHFFPWAYVNVGKNVRFKVGHAGIINKKITSSTDLYDKSSTIECYTDNGVQGLNIATWDTPHYVMGIQKVKYVWKWRGFKSGLYKVTTPVSNPDALANWANKYLGHEYVKWYEFATAKWFAPKRFTCTTLVWWCAKKAYGVNVSSWYSPLVTPSGLFTDNCTYIRANVM